VKNWTKELTSMFIASRKMLKDRSSEFFIVGKASL
jgi:hypothetical protein